MSDERVEPFVSVADESRGTVSSELIPDKKRGVMLVLSPATSHLIGRDRELDEVTRLVRDGGALLVRGDAGVGKSALLREAEHGAVARGLTVLPASGVEAEAHLPLAGLCTLLRPVLEHVDDLPAAQRDAMQRALGLELGATPDPFLVGLATLAILSRLSPVLVVVDDLHWLDRPTVETLAFVARRLPPGVAVLMAGGDRVGPGVAELQLGSLGERASAALLAARATQLDDAARRHVLTHAAGNPLALIELPKSSEWLSGQAAPGSCAPLTERLEHSFAGRIGQLQPVTRSLLLVASVDVGGVLEEILRAGRRLLGAHVTSDELVPAVTAGLLDLDEAGPRFRHPLMRSAIRQAASLSERHEAHAALAEVVADRDRRIWHRAAAALGPDEGLAVELTAAAQRAHRLAGTATALAVLERAATLSVDPVARSARLLRAAELALEMGRHSAVIELLDDVTPHALRAAERGRLAWLRDLLEEHRWSQCANVEASIDASVTLAEQLNDDGNADAALNVLLTAAHKCWRQGLESTAGELIVAAADGLGFAGERERLLAIHGLATPLRRGAEAIATLSARGPDVAADPEASRLAGMMLCALGAFDRAGPFLRVARGGLRAHGRQGLLARCLVSLAWSELHVGDPRSARSIAVEAGDVARETLQPTWIAAAQLAEATASAMCGDGEAAGELVARAASSAVPIGATSVLAFVQIARGTIDLAAGRYGEAYEQLRRMYDPTDAAHHPINGTWAVFDLAEAAIHCGRCADARAIAADLEPLAVATGSPLLVTALACARPLLADDEDAGPLFDEAFAADLLPWPLMRARLLLAHGSWLRRRRRVAESRRPLRAARETFEALGAAAWVERASQELRATGQTTRRRGGDDRDQLSPQELQIALMAAQGLTNRQIGQRLYLSHRTVGAHLYRTFPKLGISARFELADALRDVTRPQIVHEQAS